MTTIITVKTATNKTEVIFKFETWRFLHSVSEMLNSKYKVESTQSKELKQLQIAKQKYPELLCIIKDYERRIEREEENHNPHDLYKLMGKDTAKEYKFFESAFNKESWTHSECQRVSTFYNTIHDQFWEWYPGWQEKMPNFKTGLEQAVSATLTRTSYG